MLITLAWDEFNSSFLPCKAVYVIQTAGLDAVQNFRMC